MSVAVLDDEGPGRGLPCVARTAAALLLALVLAPGMPGHAGEFEPLCNETHIRHVVWDCWNPVEAGDHGECHFFGHVSLYHHAPPITWTGACRNGRAEGDGVLEDTKGNRTEGRLVEGLKDGRWKATLASGDIITGSHVEGVIHGPWTFDMSDGRFYAQTWEDGRLQGPWERRDEDGYGVAGTMTDGTKTGTWTYSWPNGVEALVPYVDGRIHGEVAVTRFGTPLGTLVHWKGKHVDGILRPVPYLPDAP